MGGNLPRASADFHAAFAPHAFSIPAFTWVNQLYRKLHPDVVAALEGNAAKDIRSHNVFYAEAEMMDITWNGFDANRSTRLNTSFRNANMKLIAGGLLVARPSAAPEFESAHQSGGATAR